MKEQLKALYLDWFNNFITLEAMASHYGLTTSQCEVLIDMGRNIYEKDILSEDNQQLIHK